MQIHQQNQSEVCAQLEPSIGSTVICLHSSASSGRQWQRLVASWTEYEVLTPNLLGYGDKGEEIAGSHSMEAEVYAVEKLILSQENDIHLVGHSFGGAVATLVALANPQRITSLTLYEPVLFPLLYASARASSGKEIWLLQTKIRNLVKLGSLNDAAQHFVDFWSGRGAYQRLSESTQNAISKTMCKVAKEFVALISNSIDAEQLQVLKVPCLLLYGSRTPKPTRDIVHLMTELLPNRKALVLEGLGHMGPIEDPDRVNAIAKRFIRRYSAYDAARYIF